MRKRVVNHLIYRAVYTATEHNFMSTLTKFAYHIVFGTKYRHPLIKAEFQKQLYEYIGGIIRAQNGYLMEIGGIEDHIHILASLPPNKAVSDAIRDIKANSSKWINELNLINTPRFSWQKGYGAFTVSYSLIESVRKYVQNQREHHQAKTFKEEYIAILKLHDIDVNLKYLFEDEFHS